MGIIAHVYHTDKKAIKINFTWLVEALAGKSDSETGNKIQSRREDSKAKGKSLFVDDNRDRASDIGASRGSSSNSKKVRFSEMEENE